MKLMFRKELFLQDVKNITVDKELVQGALTTWAEWCDGKEVTDGYIGNFIIHEDWCEIVEE